MANRIALRHSISYRSAESQYRVLVHMISDTLPPFFFVDIVPEIPVV